jgi:hypothetical protein
MDFEALSNTLYEKGARGNCAMCGQNNWAVLGPSPTSKPLPIVLHAVQKDGSMELGRGVGAAGWVCGNCGFIRLHALDVLAPEEVPSEPG